MFWAKKKPIHTQEVLKDFNFDIENKCPRHYGLIDTCKENTVVITNGSLCEDCFAKAVENASPEDRQRLKSEQGGAS